MVENKLSKNVGLLHKAKIFLNKDSMVSLYYSFIPIYLNYYYLKQPPRRVLRKSSSENTQQIYRRTLMLKCDFKKVVKKVAKFSIFSELLLLRTPLDGCSRIMQILHGATRL